jgi:hypothetical protein
MKTRIAILSSVLLVVLMLMTGVGQAAPFQGSLWEPADSYAENPASGPPGGTPTATFAVDSLNFDSSRNTLTYDSWLKGATSGNPNGLVWLTDPTPIKDTFFTSTGRGTFFQFTGTAYFPANITITHDDGFWLNLVGDKAYDFSTPVTPTATTLNNPAGTFAFTLNYGAWNGFPEVLLVPNLSPVPEPTTMFLLGLGMLGVAGIVRKVRS